MIKNIFGLAVGLLMIAVQTATASIISPPNQIDWVASKKRIKINSDVTMAYVEWGNTQEAPVILIHGYSDNSRAYSLIAPYLKGKHFIAVDLRGHGDSSAPQCCYYMSDFAEDINDFLVAKGIKKADIIGHSMGSFTAGIFAAMHPQKVKNLILISSALNPAAGGPSSLYDIITQLNFPLDPEGEFIQQFWAPNEPKIDETFLQRLRVEEAAVPARAWLGIIKGFQILDWTPAAKSISAPTMIMWGDQDSLILESDQNTLRKAIPSAKFIKYHGLGHSMYWEDPDRCANDILEFLQ